MADEDSRSDDKAGKNEEGKSAKGKPSSDKSSSAEKKDAGSAKGSAGKKDVASTSDRKSTAKTEKKAEPTKKVGEGEGGHGRGPLRFVREVMEQLRKVIWPSRKELLTYTAVVLVFVSVLTALISGFDYGFTKLILLTFGNSDTGQ